MPSVIAIDLGGTKVTTAVVDSGGRISGRMKRPAERGALSATVEQIATSVRESIDQAGVEEVRGAGLIVPGIYSKRTGQAWAPNLWGHDHVPLLVELRKTLALPVAIDSDRAGYVFGEVWLGAARGLRDVIFLAVGTGIGAGILSDGRLVRGAGDIAGAVGWFALNPAHREIYTKVGCWEAESAGPGLARRLSADSAEAVVAAARSGDASAQSAVAETARYLGMGVANLVSIFNPEMVILGGGLMQAHDLFLEPIRRVMREWAQPVAAQQVRIEMTQLGEDAGLLGAARLALEGAEV